MDADYPPEGRIDELMPWPWAPRQPPRSHGVPQGRGISLTIDPAEPDIVFAGTRPAGVYRSCEGVRHWEKLAIDIARKCSIGTPFVTSIIVDIDDHRIIWAAVRIDGVFRSLDGGDRWTHLETGLYDPDINPVTIAPTQPRRDCASTAREMFVSHDLGDTWQPWVSRRNGHHLMPAA